MNCPMIKSATITIMNILKIKYAKLQSMYQGGNTHSFIRVSVYFLRHEKQLTKIIT